MKEVCLIIVAVLATALVIDGPVRSAESVVQWQDQSGKQKDEEKSKGDSARKVTGALGTKTNPVRCDDPKGERQYLNRLRCSNGKRPEYSRIGSFGVGPYGNILDGYRVKCESVDEATIFMDMYHEEYIEKEAVPGFTIVDE